MILGPAMSVIEIPPEWAELPGHVRLSMSNERADLFLRNAMAVGFEHDISPARLPRSLVYGGYFVAHRAVLQWLGDDYERQRFIFGGLDPRVRPWLYPDRPSWPEIELFPRWSRIRARFRR